MKLVLFEELGSSAPARPGLLLDQGVVSLAGVAPSAPTPHDAMRAIIDGFDGLRPSFDRLAAEATPLPLATVRLLPPLPRPGKILCSTSLCRSQPADAPEPLLMTLKSAECVIGPNDTLELPDTFEPWQFTPEAELAVVIKGPAKGVAAEDWRDAVFGFTCAVDVAARGGTVAGMGRDNWVAKSDTLCPLGPCIVTADACPDPASLRVRSWLNDQPHQHFTYAAAEYTIGQQIAFLTTVMTLYSGDVVVLGSSDQDAGNLRDGDHAAVEIEGIGRLMVAVRDSAASRRQPAAAASH